jgi:group I intron endonuclease
MEFNGIIYCYINQVNGKTYVGQTSANRFNSRQRQHKSHTRRACPLFSNAIKKYGYNSFELRILEDDVADTKSLNDLEVYWIAKLESYGPKGYNLTYGGDGVRGRKRSKESIAKQSGPNNANYGKPMPEHVKRALSEANKKRVGEKNAFYGKKHTPETLKHLSNVNKGKGAGEDSQAAHPVVCVDVNRFFYTITMAAEWVGKAINANIASVCSGKSPHKQAGRYSWRYATEQEIEDYKNGTHSFNQEATAKPYRHKNAKAVVCLETGEFFRSASDCFVKYPVANPDKFSLSAVCGKPNRTHKGVHWRFATAEETEKYDSGLELNIEPATIELEKSRRCLNK